MKYKIQNIFMYSTEIQNTIVLQILFFKKYFKYIASLLILNQDKMITVELLIGKHYI